jgi:ureidoacrylate peracid hydrolase
MKILKDDWRIDPLHTALVVIDMQRTWLEPDSPRELAQARDLVPRINELAGICRKLGMPVINVRAVVRPDGSDVGLLKDFRPEIDSEWWYNEGKKGAEFYKNLDVKPGDYEVKKIRYSAFIPGSSNMEPLLRGLARDSIIICGIATDVCVAATTIDAMMLDFRVFLVGDLTSTFSDDRQRIALEVLGTHFAKLMMYDEIKAELEQIK